MKGGIGLKSKEAEFCRLTAVLGDPAEAARRAGLKDPEEVWPRLVARKDVCDEIRKTAVMLSKVFRDTAMCVVYRRLMSENNDALRLVFSDELSESEIAELNLSGVAEVKRNDKGIEVKFFDRIKALDMLSSPDSGGDGENGGGLIEAMRLSAMALRATAENGDGIDEV